MPDSMLQLFGQYAFWRGLAVFVVDLALIFGMVWVVMSIAGHPIHFRRPTPRGSADRVGEAQEPEAAHAPARRLGSTTPTDERRLAHLDLLAELRENLQLQGATVVLIVFAVLLLGVNHVLAGSEVATILAGITGYVLGSKAQHAAATGAAAANETQPAVPAKPA